MAEKKLRFETLQIHGGLQPDDPTGARGVAIYPTAAYRFKSCEHAAKLFDLSEGGNIYTRLQNPTTTVYEQRIAALYGAVGALAVSSGMSAILIAVLSLAAEGDNIVASPFLYGGTFTQFRISLRRLGIDCRIARSERPEDFEALIDGRTKAIYAESMGNPSCTVSDMEALGKLAKRYDVPFVADNTFGAAGYLCNPFEWGANIVVDSATKWINGHGTAMGGVIVDGGNYDWANGKFPQIDGPSEGYHGLNFHEAFGAAACIVLASGGYPGKYESGKAITGLADAEAAGATVYHAGTKRTDAGYVTAGGRVLGVTALGDTLAEAIRRAYAAAEKIHFEGAHMRRDIGSRDME